MVIVDRLLEKRENDGKPIRVGIIGAGYMGRGIALQIHRFIKGMEVVAISNRTLEAAERAYIQSGVNAIERVETVPQLEDSIDRNVFAVTDDAMLLCEAENIDALIEVTGTIEYGARVVMKAIEGNKHIILMNAELDATIGPILKVHADKAGVVITTSDGDQPGVIMNLYRYVDTIGFKPVLAGNMKGLQDPYRTPETQKGYAEKYKQKPKMVTSFADGTKISMEMAVVANATGLRAGKRGMYGPQCDHVNNAVNLFPVNEMLNGGLVDYVLGAEPAPGVFIIGYNEDPIQQQYLNYYKMGNGPFYVFYTPYHLCHLETPLTVARAVLLKDATGCPIGPPVCDVITIAKCDLKAGTVLDGMGGFTCYGMIENIDVSRPEHLLPIGMSEGCRLKTSVKKDEPVTFEQVEFPSELFLEATLAGTAGLFPSFELNDNAFTVTRASFNRKQKI